MDHPDLRTMRLALLLSLTLCALPAGADIYKYVDEDGNVTYTSLPRPGAKKLQLDDGGKAPAASVKGGRKGSAKSPTPGYFPRVDTSTQRRRDDMRRQLLMEELRSEERNLASARNAMAAGRRQPGADLNRLADSVRAHEKNIEMLNRELSLIR